MLLVAEVAGVIAPFGDAPADDDRRRAGFRFPDLQQVMKIAPVFGREGVHRESSHTSAALPGAQAVPLSVFAPMPAPGYPSPSYNPASDEPLPDIRGWLRPACSSRSTRMPYCCTLRRNRAGFQ